MRPLPQTRFPLRGSDALTFGVFLALVLPLSGGPALVCVLAVALDRVGLLLGCGALSVVGLYAAFVGSGRLSRRVTAARAPCVVVEPDALVLPLPDGPLRLPYDALTARTGWFVPGMSLGEHTRFLATVEGVQLRVAVGARGYVLGASESVGPAVDAGFRRGAVALPDDVGLPMWGADLIALEAALRDARQAHAHGGSTAALP